MRILTYNSLAFLSIRNMHFLTCVFQNVTIESIASLMTGSLKAYDGSIFKNVIILSNSIQKDKLTSAVLYSQCIRSRSGQVALLLEVAVIGLDIFFRVCTHSSTYLRWLFSATTNTS